MGQGMPGLFDAGDTLYPSSSGDGAIYDAFFPQDQGTHDLGVGYGAWGGGAIDWPSLLSSQMNIDGAQYHDSFSPTTIMDSDTPSSDNSSNFYRGMLLPKSQVLRMPTFNKPSIFHRQHTDLATQRVSQLMLQTLKSYPLMMLRQRTPPPFIHPCLLIGNANDDMEPWHNCMSLMHMMHGGVQGSRKLFWRNVRMECERFCEQVCRFSSNNVKQLTLTRA